MDRQRWLMFGVLLILLGFQFRLVQSFALNSQTTRALAKITQQAPLADNSSMTNMLIDVASSPSKTVTPPRWIGVALIAIGSVMTLQSFAMPRTS
jgi:hypothetical protein